MHEHISCLVNLFPLKGTQGSQGLCVIRPLSRLLGFDSANPTESAYHKCPRRCHMTEVPSSFPTPILARLKMTENDLVYFPVLFLSRTNSQSFTIILENVEGTIAKEPIASNLPKSDIDAPCYLLVIFDRCYSRED